MTLSRRNFVRGLAATGALAGAATALPRVRRAWGAGRTRRVVIVAIGGGLRTREVLGMAEGATMPNLFGTAPLLPGFGTSAGAVRIAPEYAARAGVLPLALPAVRPQPLFTSGALVTNLRYADGPPGHLQGHGCLVSGAYNTIENRADAKLPVPTVFELHRKATNAPATDAWYLSVPGGFYRALVASDEPGYGAAYAASYVQPPGVMQATLPLTATGKRTIDLRTEPLPTIPRDAAEDAAVARLTSVLDGNAGAYARDDLFPHADVEDAQAIQSYLAEIHGDPTYQAYFPSSFGVGLRQRDGTVAATADTMTVYHAERLLDRFLPSLMVMTLLDVDTCHNDFNGYLRNQQLADAAVAHLWSFIQRHPVLGGETALIVMPEHGRHLFFNGQNPDSLGRSGLDHGQGDDGDRDVWMLALGPDIRPGVVTAPTNVVQPGRSSGRYETIDAVMTAMTMLGHGERMTMELGAHGKRPGLVVQEVMA
jgi:hypothetical protein